MAAIRNYHKLGGLKNTCSITVLEVRNQNWVLLGQNQVVVRVVFPPGH